MPVLLRIAFNQNYATSGMTFSWTTLSIKVRNIAFSKQVDLAYTNFGSGVWRMSPLNFGSPGGNYDVFTADGTTLSSVEFFALRYRVAGAEYWDNNGGGNYHLGSTFAGVVGGNVSLSSARAVRCSEAGGGFTFDTGWLEGEILVNNLTFNKRVGIVYSRDGGASWNTVDGSFSGPVHAVASTVSGVEIWKFKTPQLNIDTSTPSYRFAVFFQRLDSGVTHWDNDFGQDYLLSKADGSTLP